MRGHLQTVITDHQQQWFVPAFDRFGDSLFVAADQRGYEVISSGLGARFPQSLGLEGLDEC